MRISRILEPLVEQINSETIDWIRLKIKKLIGKYKGQLPTSQIHCDANDWFTVQAISKVREIDEVLGHPGWYKLDYLSKEKVRLIKIDIEEGNICILCSPEGYSGQFYSLNFPDKETVNFDYVDHKNFGETLKKLEDKVEELLSLMEKKFQEVIQTKEGMLGAMGTEQDLF